MSIELPAILVTAVCGDLGSSVVRALGQEKYRLIGIDASHYCPVTEFLSFFEVVPLANDPAYIEKLLELCEKYKIQAILPLSEAEIIRLNSERTVFALRNIHLVLHPDNVLNTFFDKYATIQYIASLGYTVPKTILLDKNKNPDLTLPFIVKPRQGCGSRGVMVISDEFARDGLSYHSAGMIAQELIGSPAHEYTTGVFSDGTRTVSITFRRVLAKGGYSHEVHLSDDDHIKRLARDIASSIKLVGSINIQTRKVMGRHIPFEINPRLSSTVMFRALAGFTDAHWWLQTVLYKKNFTYSPLEKDFTGIRHMIEKVFF